MSYYSEHQRMRPVLDLARQLDIGTNPHPRAIFESAMAVFKFGARLKTTLKAGMESQ